MTMGVPPSKAKCHKLPFYIISNFIVFVKAKLRLSGVPGRESSSDSRPFPRLFSPSFAFFHLLRPFHAILLLSFPPFPTLLTLPPFPPCSSCSPLLSQENVRPPCKAGKRTAGETAGETGKGRPDFPEDHPRPRPPKRERYRALFGKRAEEERKRKSVLIKPVLFIQLRPAGIGADAALFIVDGRINSV